MLDSLPALGFLSHLVRWGWLSELWGLPFLLECADGAS